MERAENQSDTSDETVSMTSTEDDSGDCSRSEDEDEPKVAILCELVGARNLKFQDNHEDVNSNLFRAYCEVKLGGRLIHRSKRASDIGCNPIWAVSRKSLFMLRVSPTELSKSHLNIAIYAKPEESLPVRLLSSNNLFLGQVNLDPSAILDNCNDTRFEVNIRDELNEEGSNLGTIALRFRIATRSDQKIMKAFNDGLGLSKRKSKQEFVDAMLESSPDKLFGKSTVRPQAKLITETNESEIARTSFVNALNYVFSTRTLHDKATGRDKFRLKPYPDPSRLKETQFMSKYEILSETRKPSHQWVEAGSGSLGKLYVEVLSCHDLPNVDVGEAVGNVTDSFVTLVYEDTCAMTEVIDDELSPHWLPWTQRAFCFGMMHPASLLYLGVFDYDLGPGNHEALGRVAVNVANLQRNTVHTLKYNLYPSSNITDRIAVGSVTIRLRIECFDEKAALLVALNPRPRIHVNVKKEKSFKVIRYTCFGEYDNEEKFDLTVTKSYINEFWEYKAALGYAYRDTFSSLMFWRGQVEFCSILMPLHSFLFFCMATDLVERPYKIVPYSLLGVAWIMIATNTMRRQHPSYWKRPPSFWQYLDLLRTGKSSTPVEIVKEYEGHKEATAYENSWEARMEQDRLLAERAAELQTQIDYIGDDNISTQVANSAIPLDLMNRLTRYQGTIGRWMGKFRFIKIIVTWEESIVSFWFTASFLAAGLVALILPWNFILLWTGRIVVWGLFGPHMKIVDLYLRSNKKNDEAVRALMQNFDVQSKMARLRREEAVKQKDIKSIAFGKYSVQVPSYNIARHYDRPLPGSSARICRRGNQLQASRRLSVASISDTTPWIPGQQLFGTMVPRPEREANVFEGEKVQLEQRLAILKKRVSDAKRAGIKPRRNPAPTPRHRVSFGYEVIPHAMEEEAEDSPDDISRCSSIKDRRKLRNRLSVVLTTHEEEDFVDISSANEVILEHDGASVYEVCEDGDSAEDEEGMEVVGLGRYSTVVNELEESFSNLMASGSLESVLHDKHSRLSQQYPSSRNVDVAFYRPLTRVERPVAQHEKED